MRMFMAQHTIITPVVGYNFKTALTLHNFHSQGSIPCRAAYQANTYTTLSFTSYRVPIYAPGWRAAMWIKCLGEGQKCQALTGIEPATLWSRVRVTPIYHGTSTCMKAIGVFDTLSCYLSIIFIFKHSDTKILGEPLFCSAEEQQPCITSAWQWELSLPLLFVLFNNWRADPLPLHSQGPGLVDMVLHPPPPFRNNG